MKLVLASSSPRRARLLENLGLSFETRTPAVDETRKPDEAPGAYVERLARDKALAVLGREEVVVAADTVVVQSGRVLGKPAHPEEARSMLRRLQGEMHEVLTGIAVARFDDGPIVVSALDVSEVRFLTMTEDEIADYVDTGEPMDKAGAYALQGKGGVFVERVGGSPFTIVGLPLHLLPRLVSRVGADIRRFEDQG